MIVFRLTPEEAQAIKALHEKGRLVEEHLASTTACFPHWSARKKTREIVAQCVQQRDHLSRDICRIVYTAQQRDEEQHERRTQDALQQWEEP